jgi:hypothetical protein
VDSSKLEALAEGGFVAVGPDEFEGLSEWCWDWAIATGDARFAVISRILRAVDEWWDIEQGRPSKLVTAVEGQLCAGLKDALGAADPASGAQFAHQMGQGLPLLNRSQEWRDGGWLDA